MNKSELIYYFILVTYQARALNVWENDVSAEMNVREVACGYLIIAVIFVRLDSRSGFEDVT